MANLLNWFKNEVGQVSHAIGGAVHGAEQDASHFFHPQPNQQQQQNTVNNINQATGGSPVQRAQQAPVAPPPHYINPISAIGHGLGSGFNELSNVAQQTAHIVNTSPYNPAGQFSTTLAQTHNPTLAVKAGNKAFTNVANDFYIKPPEQAISQASAQFGHPLAIPQVAGLGGTPALPSFTQNVAQAKGPLNKGLAVAEDVGNIASLIPVVGGAAKGFLKGGEAITKDLGAGGKLASQTGAVGKDVGKAKPNPLDVAHQETVKNGGATINLEGNQPAKGYAYAPAKGTEMVVPTKDLTPQHIADFAKTNADQLNQPGNHIGTWSNPEDGNTYIDISKVGSPSAKTIAEAQGANQLAVHDLSNHNDIPIGQIDKNGVYSPHDKASSIHNQYQGQIAGASSSGGVSGAPKIPQDVQAGTSKAPKPPQVSTPTASGPLDTGSRQLAKELGVDPASQKILQKTPPVGSPKEALDMNVAGAGKYKAPGEPVATPPSEKVKFPVSQLKTLEAQGNAGKALAQKTVDVQATTDRLGAASEDQIPTVLNIKGKAESHNFQNVLRGTEAPINAKVAQAVQEWQSFSPSFRATAEKAGVRVGDRGPNYFPQNSNFAGDNYQNALSHLVKTGQAQDIGQATRLLDEIRSTPMPRKSSYFKPRTLDTGLNHNNVAAVARDYISQGTKNIAETTHYGRGLGKVDHLIGRIQAEGGDAQKARKIINNLVAPEYNRSVGAKALRGGRKFMSAAKLGTAVISHAGQPLLNDTTRAGFGPTLKAYATRYTKANKQLVKDTGINYNLERQRQLEQSVGSRLSKITAPGLTSLQKFNRGIATAAGKYHAQDLVKRASQGDVKALDEMRNKLGIKGEIGKTLTPEQIIQAGRNEAVATHFSNNPAELPLFHSSELGKTVLQFRAAYGIKQTGFIINEVLKEARKGNFKPLTRFAVMAPIVGTGIYAGKAAVSNVADDIFNGGKNQQSLLPGSVLEAASKGGGFGLPGSIAEGFKYVNNANGKPDTTKTLVATTGAVAPLAGELAKTVVNTTKAIGGNSKPLVRQGVGEAPIVGSALANLVAPYGPKAPKPPGGDVAHAGGPSPLTLEQQVAQNKLDKSKDVNQNLKVSDYLTKDQQNFLKLTPQQQGDYLKAHPEDAYLAKANDEKRAAEQIIKGVHPDLPQGLDANSVKVLTNYDRLSQQGKDKFKDSPQNNYNLAQANFNKDVASGKLNTEEQYTKQQSLDKLKIETGYSQEVSQLYGFSKTKLIDFFAKNPDKAGLFDQVKGLDKALADAGLAKQKFQYGLGSKGRKAAKGRTPKIPKIPKFSTPKTAKFSQPKGVKVKAAAYKPYKPKKIAVSKMPKIA